MKRFLLRKEAAGELTARFARWLSTPIKGTPKLVQKMRTGPELDLLEQGIRNNAQRYVEDPIRRGLTHVGADRGIANVAGATRAITDPGMLRTERQAWADEAGRKAVDFIARKPHLALANSPLVPIPGAGPLAVGLDRMKDRFLNATPGLPVMSKMAIAGLRPDVTTRSLTRGTNRHVALSMQKGNHPYFKRVPDPKKMPSTWDVEYLPHPDGSGIPAPRALPRPTPAPPPLQPPVTKPPPVPLELRGGLLDPHRSVRGTPFDPDWIPGYGYQVKAANGDMLQYFADNPQKLKEKQERDRAKKRRKEKRAAELTMASRDKLKTKVFAIPGQRRYPIHDEKHARSALGFVKMHGSPGEQAQVRAAVDKRYPGLEKSAQVMPYQQETEWTCSAACLKAVLEHYGTELSEQEAVQIVGARKNRGAECDEIMRAAHELGFDSCEYSFDSLEQAKWLLDQDIPIICDIQSFNHPGKGHYVVLIRVDESGAHLMDPNTPGNQRTISHEEMEDRWWDNAMAPPHALMTRWGVIVLPPEEMS